jgi:hypothetical protein
MIYTGNTRSFRLSIGALNLTIDYSYKAKEPSYIYFPIHQSDADV